MAIETTETGVPHEHTRREFLANSTLLTAFIALSVGAVNALVRFVYPPPQGAGGGEQMAVTAKAELPLGQSHYFTYQDAQYALVHVDQGFRAFSRVCTHAGCLVAWEGATRTFKCPCHAAVFDVNGGVVSGPAPKPLAELKVSEVGDKIMVGG